MKHCDVAMPMCYWGYYGDQKEDAVDWLNWCIEEYESFTDKPIIPVGRAYRDTWEFRLTLRPDAVQAYSDRVRELDIEGESWWELAWTYKRRKDVFDIISDLSGWDDTPMPQPEPYIHQANIPKHILEQGNFIIEVKGI